MPEIDPVVLEVRADVEQYRRQIKGASTLLEKEFGIQEKRARRLEQEMRRSSGNIGSSLKGLAASVAAAFSAREVVGLLDSFTRYQNALRVAGLEGQNLAQVQEKLFEVAQRNGVQLEAVGTLYGRAAQSAKSLGASQAELLGFTKAVSASLRITGTSTQEASGSLLQLGQALGSPRVQAEEFNSLLDTMRPLLIEASRFIDGTGGSLDGLIRKLKDTKGPGVSNIELFQGIVRAQKALEDQTGRTALTVSAGLNSISNALTKYLGEADKANGVSAALGAALQTIAKNIDTLIPALAIVATAMGSRLVAGAVGGTAALKAAAAYAGVATTSLAGTALAARSAGTALLTAFGGPVGAAITAVVVGIGAMAANASTTESRVSSLRQSIDETDAETASLARKLADAGVATDSLGRFAVDASGKVTGLGNSMSEAARRTAELVAKLRELNIYSDLQSNLGRQDEIFQELKALGPAEREAARRRNSPELSQTRTGDALNRRAGEAAELRRELNLLKDQQQSLELRAQSVRLAFENGVSLDPTPPTSAIASSSLTRGRKTDAEAEARREAQVRARYADEIEQLYADELAARAGLTGSIDDRLKADLERLDANARSFARQVALDEDLDRAQQEKLIAERAEVDALERRRLIRDAEIVEIERRTRVLADLRAADEAVLRSQLSFTKDRNERAEIERKLLALQVQQEKAELQTLLKTRELAGAKQDELDAIRRRIEAIDESAKNQGRAIDEGNKSPLQRYLDDLQKTDTEIRDAAEQLAVDEVERLRGGLRDGIAKLLGTDDPFITGLIDLLVEQLLLRPLAEALAGAPGAGGGLDAVFGALGGLFGGFRANGGPVSAGKTYVVGEGGEPEFFTPGVSGQITPLSRLPLAGSGAGSGPIRIEVQVVEGQIFEARVAGIAEGRAVQVVQVAQPQLTEVAVSETIRRVSRPTL